MANSGAARDDADDPGRAEEQAAERQAVSAYVVYKALAEEAKEEFDRPAVALACSGLSAGLSISFSVVAEALLTFYLRAASDWKPLVTKLGYSVGFLIVVRGRQQLFTENTLTPVLPLLERRDRSTFGKVLRLWTIVLVTNLIGTAVFAVVLAKTPVFEPELKAVVAEMSRRAMEPTFGVTVLRGVFAGWLLALMVWLLPAAESGRIAVIVILTYLIGLGHFSHVVAGSTEAFYLAATGETSWAAALGGFVVPAFLGNVIGGVTLVAALNFGQASKGSSPAKKD